MRILIWLIFIVALAGSCLEQPDCINLQNNIVGITFKDSTNADFAQAIDTVRAGNDSIVVMSVTSPKIFLPLNYFDDRTFYFITIDDTLYNLVLKYRSQPQYVSEDCGNRFDISDLEVYYHEFDSVRVINHKPGINQNANNILIFR